MKRVLAILFVALLLAAYRPDAGTAHDAKSSKDQYSRKQAHTHDHEPKSKYDLRNIDKARPADDSHTRGHIHVHTHDHKPKSKYDLRDLDRHDERNAHRHDHGDAHHHHEDDHGAHNDHTHDGRGHDHGHGDHHHEEGVYDRVWDVATLG